MSSTVERELELRALTRMEEFDACVELQRRVWGFDDADLVPSRMFLIAAKTGGQVFGAWEGARLAGYALAFVGDRHGRIYLHSHMLAVDAAFRNSGLGRRLKLRQREDALERGIELMEWTFDPLEIKNAYFNLRRLGAIARIYVANQYGQSSSRLQGELPTDRLVAEWWLRSPRVVQTLAQGLAPDFAVTAKVEVPAEIARWKQAGDPRAGQLQAANRHRLEQAFAAGQAALGYERRLDGSGAFLLGHWEGNWGQ